jgi:lysophospholipase L1-like esterase
LPDTAASSIVIIAFGTNDLAVLGLTPQEAFDAIVNLRNTSEAAGHTTFVATVPPRPIPGDGLAEQINALLLASSIPSDRIIDFYTGFDDLVDPDGVHFINAGHELRAARALMMLEKCTN